MTFFILLIVGIVPAFGIAIQTGRTGLSVLISLIIWIVFFTITNMGGGHFNEALGMGFGMSWAQAIPNYIAAALGAELYNKKIKAEKS